MLTGRQGSRLICFGSAGTGKSFLIKEIVKTFNCSILAAPTGRAATIIGGSTIHKLFGIPSTHPINPDFKDQPVHRQRFNDPSCRYFGGQRKEVLKHCSWIILDEIGMVRCDHLDFIEAALRKARGSFEPFGGAKILCVGDVGQLPPVAQGRDAGTLKRYGYKAPFGLFQSNVLNTDFHQVSLTKVIRQENPIEANILNRIRVGAQTKIDIDYLNTRVQAPDSKAVILTPLRKIRDEIKDSMLQSAQAAGAGNLPKEVQRMITELTEPKMNWRELIRQQIQSTIRNDYTFARPSRKGWHTGAVLPGMNFMDTIDICIGIDMSGSIGNQQAEDFLGEVKGIMDEYKDYKIKIWCFDTNVYNEDDFSADDGRELTDYEVIGGGGTDFDVNWTYMKEQDIQPKKFLMFTDGYPFGSWGDEDYCDTVFVIHSNHDKALEAPFGMTAHYEENVA